MLKFGLLLVLANIFLKLFVGIGLWKMGMEYKSGFGKNSSVKYEEEQIGEGDPNILRGQNDANRQGRIFPASDNDNKFQLRESEDGED